MGRLVARIVTRLKEIHSVGLPVSVAGEAPTPMPSAEWVVMQPGNGGVYLFRYSKEGDDAGDTWHLTESDARDQALFEFGLKGSDWIEVPKEVEDAIGFVLSRLE